MSASDASLDEKSLSVHQPLFDAIRWSTSDIDVLRKDLGRFKVDEFRNLCNGANPKLKVATERFLAAFPHEFLGADNALLVSARQLKFVPLPFKVASYAFHGLLLPPDTRFLREIATFSSASANFEALDFSNCNLHTDEDWDDVVSMTQKFQVKVLLLHGNRFSASAHTETALKLLLDLPHLEFVTVYGNYFASIDSKDMFVGLGDKMTRVVFVPSNWSR
jgi:hypothetical protein